MLAQFLTEVCPNVSIETVLQPITGDAFYHRSANACRRWCQASCQTPELLGQQQEQHNFQCKGTLMCPSTARHRLLLATAEVSLKRDIYTVRGAMWIQEGERMQRSAADSNATGEDEDDS